MAEAIGHKNLVLVFTQSMGLTVWIKKGNFHREIAIYRKLAEYGWNVYFLTYDAEIKKEIIQHLYPIKVLNKKWKMPNKLYAFLAPFLWRTSLPEAGIVKTNQIKGWWTAFLIKLIKRNYKLVLRCGYLWSVTYGLENSKMNKLVVNILEKLAYKVADKAIVTTYADKKFAMEKYRVSENKIEVIPNYVDVTLFKR